MKKNILAVIAGLFLGQFYLVSGQNFTNDPDVVNIMNKNTNHSGTNTASATITFKAIGNGVPVAGYLFSKETSNTLTLTAFVGGILSLKSVSSNDAWGSQQYVFNDNPQQDASVRFQLHAAFPVPGVDFFNDQKSSGDNLYHIMAKSFSGYDRANIPNGIWMGWEDNDPIRSGNGSDYDYNDICFILQGVKEYATDFDGHTVLVKTPPANMGVRIIAWREENKF